MKVLIFFEFIHEIVICLMVGGEVWPALSNPNECSWFEPSVAIIFLPTAFLSFLCV